MKRASPALIRHVLEVAHNLAKSGILFVPMPVADEEEYNRRVDEGKVRIDEMIANESEGIRYEQSKNSLDSRNDSPIAI